MLSLVLRCLISGWIGAEGGGVPGVRVLLHELNRKQSAALQCHDESSSSPLLTYKSPDQPDVMAVGLKTSLWVELRNAAGCILCATIKTQQGYAQNSLRYKK